MSSERLVEYDQPRPAAAQGPAEAHSLSFPAGKKAPAPAERRLEAILQSRQHLVEIAELHHLTQRQAAVGVFAVEEVLGHGSVPELNRGVHPGRLLAEAVEPLCVQRLDVDELGLDKMDRRILHTIAVKFSGFAATVTLWLVPMMSPPAEMLSM